jgi:hypothetical protein
MSTESKRTKEELIQLIEKLERNPNDIIGIIADAGITVLGVAGGGATAALFGATTTSIPIITALTGISLFMAAPVTLIAGAAIAGGAAAFGVSRLIKDGGFHEGKHQQLLNELNENLKEIELKERKSSLNEQDKIKFYSFLKEPINHQLISPDDAHKLIEFVNTGRIPLREAYKLMEQIIKEVKDEN